MTDHDKQQKADPVPKVTDLVTAMTAGCTIHRVLYSWDLGKPCRVTGQGKTG